MLRNDTKTATGIMNPRRPKTNKTSRRRLATKTIKRLMPARYQNLSSVVKIDNKTRDEKIKTARKI
jgi:hypothetical protein